MEVPTIQIVLSSSDDTHKRVPGQEGLKLRALAAQNMSKLVRIQGIVISVSPVRAKATHLTIQCRNCREQKVQASKAKQKKERERKRKEKKKEKRKKRKRQEGS